MKLLEVFKPSLSGRMHSDARVAYGKNAQDAVISDLKNKYGKDFKLISTAIPASQAPDIVAEINNVPLQFEVKNRADKNAAMTVFNTTVTPNRRDPMLDMLAQSMSGGTAVDFNHLMQQAKRENATAGWPGEKQAPKSGSINIRTTDPDTIAKVRRQLMRQLKASHDDYFVVVTPTANTIDYYSIGGNNPLQAPGLPPISRIILKTDGAPYRGSMRVAIKIQLSK